VGVVFDKTCAATQKTLKVMFFGFKKKHNNIGIVSQAT